MTAIALPGMAGMRISRRVKAFIGCACASRIFCRRIARSCPFMKDRISYYRPYGKDGINLVKDIVHQACLGMTHEPVHPEIRWL